MIEQMMKTFEYFPKQKGEEDRALTVINYHDEMKLRLIVYINGLKHTSEQIISKLEYGSFKGDYEEVMLRRICRNLSDLFTDKTQ